MLEANYEAKLEFPRGRGDVKQKPFHGRSMGILWNCTLYNYSIVSEKIEGKESAKNFKGSEDVGVSQPSHL